MARLSLAVVAACLVPHVFAAIGARASSRFQHVQTPAKRLSELAFSTVVQNDAKGIKLHGLASSGQVDQDGAAPPKGAFGPIQVAPPAAKGTFGASYARFVQLGKGKIIMTFTGNGALPIMESLDYGLTWAKISSVPSHVANGTMVQPYLYVLPHKIGELAEGTLLLAANVFFANSTEIELFASGDAGRTWTFVSVVAAAKNVIIKDKDGKGQRRQIFEPSLLYYDGQLICYYSDERDPKHSQKLAHQTTIDGVTWSDVVNDVAEPDEWMRPGMTNLALMNDKNYVLVYEFMGAPEKNFTVYMKKSANPLEFDKVKGRSVVAEDGTAPLYSPYVAWTPSGGPNGTLIVSAASTSNIFLNHAHGEGRWTNITTKSHSGYSPAVEVAEYASNIVLIATGAPWGRGNDSNGVTFTAMQLPSSAAGASL